MWSSSDYFTEAFKVKQSNSNHFTEIIQELHEIIKSVIKAQFS